MKTSELSSSLRLLITGLHKLLRKHVSQGNNFSLTELETIGHLYRNDSLEPTELASLTRVKNQSMSQILKKLEGQQIIQRIPSEKDRRKVNISITDLGKNMVLNRKSIKDEWLKNQIEQNLTVEEQEKIIELLPVLQKLLEIRA